MKDGLAYAAGVTLSLAAFCLAGGALRPGGGWGYAALALATAMGAVALFGLAYGVGEEGIIASETGAVGAEVSTLVRGSLSTAAVSEAAHGIAKGALAAAFTYQLLLIANCTDSEHCKTCVCMIGSVYEAS